MIIEIVRFKHKDGVTRQEVVEGAETVVGHWQANPELIRKHFLVSEDNREGLGIYVWPSREAAQKAHNSEWIARKKKDSADGEISITYYDFFLEIDNERGMVRRF